MTETVVPLNDADFDLQLPKPVGYRLLIALPQPEEKYEGTSVLKTEKEKQMDHIMSIIGLVVDMGAEAYSDEDRHDVVHLFFFIRFENAGSLIFFFWLRERYKQAVAYRFR